MIIAIKQIGGILICKIILPQYNKENAIKWRPGMSKTRIINQYLLSAKSKALKRLHNNAEQVYVDLSAVLKKKYSKCEEVTEGSALKIEHTFHNETKNCYFVYKKSSSIARHYVSVFTLETGTAGLELLEEVCNTVFKTDSVLSNYYDIIVLRDGISEK